MRTHTLLSGNLRVIAVCIALAGMTALQAGEPGTASPDNNRAAPATELSVTIATTLEMQLTLRHERHLGENLKAVFSCALSPVSVNLDAETAWTVLPFLELSAGGRLGTGWNIPLANGLRFNTSDGSGGNRLTGGDLDGVVWSARAGGALQFDWAAIRPGEWNHILFRSYQGLRYRAWTAAGADDSWLWEADTGENRNGWTWNGNLFLGYGMPLPVSLIGFYGESDLALNTTPGRRYWGEDLVSYIFGPLAVVSLGERLSLAFLAQWQTERNFTEETADNGFYQARRVDRSDPYRLEFYRVAVTAVWKF